MFRFKSKKNTRSPTVLIVEDEPGILESVTLFLEMEGFRVLGASDGRRALELLTRIRCDVVMADLMMPYMDGAELIEHIRADPRQAHVPVILSSPALPPDSKIPELADVFLCRPFEIKRVVEVIKLLCERTAGTSRMHRVRS